MILRPVQEDAEEAEEYDDEYEADKDDEADDESNKERIRGIIFGRSVRSSYCVLHVARYLQEVEVKDTQDNNNNNNDETDDDDDDDDNLEPILIRVQFQSEDPRALRSYCRRFCKLGDLLQLQSGAWKAIDERIETEWQSPRLIVDLISAQEAQAVLRVVRTRHWTIQKCQSWQREYLKTSNPMQAGRGSVDDDESESGSVISTASKASFIAPASSQSSTTTSHGGGLGKRTQGEYVTNFLIHMMASKSESEETRINDHNKTRMRTNER
jgi:hypothetical protein